MAAKKSKKTMGKKDLKRTKGGLLPAVNETYKEFNFNTGLKVDGSINLQPGTLDARFK